MSSEEIDATTFIASLNANRVQHSSVPNKGLAFLVSLRFLNFML
jgi:hypothetical protein